MVKISRFKDSELVYDGTSYRSSKEDALRSFVVGLEDSKRRSQYGIPVSKVRK